MFALIWISYNPDSKPVQLATVNVASLATVNVASYPVPISILTSAQEWESEWKYGLGMRLV